MKKTKRLRRRRCHHCHQEYVPDVRTAEKQRFCGRRECQKARRRRTARVWRRRNHLSDQHDVARVRVWRESHPGYWRKHRRRSLLLELLVPIRALRRTQFWARLTQPRSGALRILNLAQHLGKPCVVKELLSALRIPNKKAACPCYSSVACQDCDGGRREARPCRRLRKNAGRKAARRKTKRP